MFNKKKHKNVAVYVVDDDDLFLRILENKFKTSTNYSIYTYSSASDFLIDILRLDLAKNQQVIAILNYDLETRFVDEVKDGIEILKAIKDSNPEIDVILTSKEDNVDAASTAMRFGAVTFLRKSENAFLRILNSIKWLISEKDLSYKRFQFFQAIRLFLLIVISSIIVSLVVFYLYY